MKKIISITVFVLLITKVYAQLDSLENKVFNNDSIQYKIVFTSPYPGSKDQVVHWRVKLKLSQAVIGSLLNKDSCFWIKHLRNERSDWATNLVLYSIYKQEANHLDHVYPNRQAWLRIKQPEIDWWSKFLSSKEAHSQ